MATCNAASSSSDGAGRFKGADLMMRIGMMLCCVSQLAQAQAPDQAEYLTAHNAARRAVGVPDLVWNDTAYSVAAAWAAGCVFEHNADRGPYGENIAVGTGLTATAAVELWVAEKANYTRDTNYCSTGVRGCLHYTQVMWNTTTSVGCASADCGSNLGIFHVCDYSPPGNVGLGAPY